MDPLRGCAASMRFLVRVMLLAVALASDQANVLASEPLEQPPPGQPKAQASAAKPRPTDAPGEAIVGRGAPQARVTIVEFADFQCPFCGRVLPVLERLLAEYPDQIRLQFKHFPLSFHPDAALAHEAALAAGEQGKFWEMHDWIFANQKTMKRADLIQAAKGLELDVAKFVADLDSRRFKAAVEADREEGARLGVNGTPTFFVNRRMLVGAAPIEEFKKLVEAELHPAAERVGTAESEADSRPPEPAAPEAAAPARGPADAPLTLVWYSDFQSPLTPKAAQLLWQLMGAYPEKIRLVIKHRPLDFHRDAVRTHEAALAAGAQGKFWEMHELILSNQKALRKEDLVGYAERLGLDGDRFRAALDQRSYRSVVNRDLLEAEKRQIRGSPVFFLNGKRIDGLQPLAAFKEIIEVELKKLAAGGSQ